MPFVQTMSAPPMPVLLTPAALPRVVAAMHAELMPAAPPRVALAMRVRPLPAAWQRAANLRSARPTRNPKNWAVQLQTRFRDLRMISTPVLGADRTSPARRAAILAAARAFVPPYAPAIDGRQRRPRHGRNRQQ